MEIQSIKNVLVIGAHFDDSELGCGGTMAKLAANGVQVYKLTLTDNVTDFKQMNITVGFNDSLRDSAKACEVLGVKEITDFEFVECNKLSYCSEVMQRVETIIFKYEIDTVFIHFPDDFNQDHTAASQICKTAARHCRNILFYKSNGYADEVPFNPSVFVDISGEPFEKKKLALAQYQGDHNRFNRLFDVALKKTEIWGYANKAENAEGFVPLKVCF